VIWILNLFWALHWQHIWRLAEIAPLLGHVWAVSEIENSVKRCEGMGSLFSCVILWILSLVCLMSAAVICSLATVLRSIRLIRPATQRQQQQQQQQCYRMQENLTEFLLMVCHAQCFLVRIMPVVDFAIIYVFITEIELKLKCGISGVVVRMSDSYLSGRGFESHCRPLASNLEQVANLRCAQVNSASYPSRDRKSVVAYELRGEGIVWLIGALVCLCAAPQVQLFASTGNGWPHNAQRYH